MDSTETKYNFYKRALKGGAQPQVQQVQAQVQPQYQAQPQLQTQYQAQPQPTQTETINIQGQTQAQPEQEQTQDQSEQQNYSQTQSQTMETDGASLQQLNQEVPKNKINFKVASIVGNLDQTLGEKQKINFDKLLMKQLFGSD